MPAIYQQTVTGVFLPPTKEEVNAIVRDVCLSVS